MSRRALALAPLLLLLLIAAWSLIWRALDFGRPQAPPSDWQAAAAAVLEGYEPADAIWINPWWDESAMPTLATQPAHLLRQRELLPEDLEGVARLWVLTDAWREQEARQRLPSWAYDASAAAPPQRWSHGQVQRWLLTLPAGATTYPYSLRARLSEAQVWHVDGPQQTPCSTYDEAARAWRCPGQASELWVSASTRELGEDFHDCVWAPPPGKGKSLRIRYPQVPLGARLRLRAGLTLRAARLVGEPVSWRVRVAQQTLHEQTLPATQTTWDALDLDTSRWAGSAQPVELEIWTPQQERRFFCFNGWVMP